ncbi:MULTISPECIES: hypothetical protein [unclassified Cyanobium]|uniref:hypothetical protein n=1 Tax=unclassified Cyanobium TaxID=2627006 RepID=UPI0020CD1D03|nr:MULTISPECIES: hypothetical protein [unclassified Cyanobium]MCP9861082.1 hypothetical protein [Cyanobium sp. Cruz-8H5]MCP9868316.1 hypothetical protein [Cyanobium sp. Cruz-8D1]
MKDKDPYAFLDDIKAEIDAEREVEYTVTPQEAADLRKRYPSDTPDAYKKIKPEEFFDG